VKQAFPPEVVQRGTFPKQQTALQHFAGQVADVHVFTLLPNTAWVMVLKVNSLIHEPDHLSQEGTKNHFLHTLE
jgi:hypothetical protein